MDTSSASLRKHCGHFLGFSLRKYCGHFTGFSLCISFPLSFCFATIRCRAPGAGLCGQVRSPSVALAVIETTNDLYNPKLL